MKSRKLMNALFATMATGMLVAAPASANDGKIRFSLAYSDLDLTTTAGVVELHERIEKAGRKACGVRLGYEKPTLHQWRAEQACLQAVSEAALERIEASTELSLAEASDVSDEAPTS